MVGTVVRQMPFTATGPDVGLLPIFSIPNGLSIAAGSWTAAYWAGDPNWTPPASGAAVTSWRDGSGGGRNGVQAAALALPTFLSSDPNLNNKPSLQFTGTQVLNGGSLSASVTIPISWVGIVRASSVPVSGQQLFAGSVNTATNQGAGLLYSSTDSRAEYGVNPNPALSGGTADTAAHLIATVTSNTVGKVLVDGASVASGATGTTATNSVSIGAGLNSTPALGSAWKGSIAFVGLYAGDVTTASWWSSFKAWAAAHYSLTVV